MTCPSCSYVNPPGAARCQRCSFANSSESDLATRVVSSPGSQANLATIVTAEPTGEADVATRYVKPQGGQRGTSNWSQPLGASAVQGQIAPGTLLGGRYEFLKSLGQGGMGAVYQARDLEVDRVVAIKIIRPELADNPEILRRFKQELILARQITHRNVVRIYDLGVADEMKFISMEFIEGRELAEVLAERGKIEPKEAAAIMLQVMQGLNAAHTAGVVHRDLKPQNIMVAEDGRAAVMDFGIALSSGVEAEAGPDAPDCVDERLTLAGSLLGTPRYMSPEQVRCEKVDARSDLFTAGIIFYELLTGEVPFTASTAKEALLKRTKHLAVPAVRINPDVPVRFSEIASKCLQTDPALRYQSAQEVIEALSKELGLNPHPGPWRWVATAFAALTMAAAGLLVRDRFFAKPVGPHAPVKLLVSDFRNETGNPVLTGTLEPMFSVVLEGASFITSYNRGQARKLAGQLHPGATTLDKPLARLVANREGLGVVVDGSIARDGAGYRLSAEAVDSVTGKTIASGNAKASNGQDVPPAVARIAAKIRAALGDSTSQSAQITAAETFTSGSLEAGQKYAQAQEAQWAGKWDDAIAAYSEAIRLDPHLGRAYAGMAVTLANSGRRPEAEKQYQKALARIDRMSDREKYRTRGGYYLLERDYQRATEQFRAVEKQYPSDTAAIANLALAYFYGRNMPAALEEGRRAVAIYPNNLLQRNNVGLYAMYSGDFESAIKESRALLKLNPAFEKAELCLGLSQLAAGQTAEALQAFDRLAALSKAGASEAALAKADAALYQGHYARGAQLLSEGIAQDTAEKSSSAVNKQVVLAQMELHRGNKARAVAMAEAAVKNSEEEAILFPAAEIFIEIGSPAKARELASRLSNRFGPDPQAYAKLILGELKMKEGASREAAQIFQDAQKTADTWMGRLLLGRAYLEAKAYPEADSEFDVCLKRRGEATAVFLDDEPSYRYFPQVYFYSGLAREGLHSEGARDAFTSFLNIRGAGEPDAMVREARTRTGTH